MAGGPRRVAAIGLDATEWTLVERMLSRGELPHLDGLRRRSAVALLHDEDYRTGLVWEQFLTGRSAGGNRRWSAVRFDPGSYQAWQEGAHATAPFYASSEPLATVAFDVPYSLPSYRAEGGAVVTSWGGHDPGHARSANPRGLLREIDATFGPHPAFNNDYEPIWNRPASIEALADALVVGCRRRADISLWLLRRFPSWELFLTVMSEGHSAGEQLWHGVDHAHPAACAGTATLAGRRLVEVYRALDDAVGRLLAGLPDDATVVVFSMHGMQGNDVDLPSMVLLPELMHRSEFGQPLLLGTADGGWARSGRAPIVPAPHVGWNQYLWELEFEQRPLHHRLGHVASSWLTGAYQSARRSVVHAAQSARTYGRRGHDPGAHHPPMVGALGRGIPDETEGRPEDLGSHRLSLEWQSTYRYRQHWPLMRAFALPSFYDGQVRLNVEGREGSGVVPQSRYGQACDEVEALLGACRDPRSGRAAVADVVRLRDGDPLSPDGHVADLQVRWSGPLEALEHPRLGTVGPLPYRRTGGHGPNGFAFVAGPRIEPCDLGLRDALDVTPTILALLGRPVDPRCEGSPLVALPEPS